MFFIGALRLCGVPPKRLVSSLLLTRLRTTFVVVTLLLAASFAHATTTATMTSPANGATASGTITISASISSSVGYASVVFWADNWTQIGSSSSPQLLYNSGAISNGNHQFFVSVLDSAGNTLAASDIVTANVQNTTTATMVSPASGATISGQITISASVQPATGYASVAFWADNWTRIGSASSPQLTYNTAALANGNHTFFITVLDSQGAALAASNIIPANVQNSAIPSLTMSAPGNGSTVSGTITVSTSVNTSVSSVTFYSDTWSNPIATVSAAPYQTSFNTVPIVNGSHSFWATAQNAAGSGASNVLTVNVQNVGPPPLCTPIAPMASTDQNGFDMLNAFNSVPPGGTGPYYGAGTWPASWYYLNIGYLGYVDLMPGTVKGYIGYYLAHTNSDWSIDTNPDSDDAFASTLLSLASVYYRVTCDQAFFSTTVSGKGVTVLQALKNVANNNLVNAAFPNGMVHTFQSASQYPIAYDEDNSENYKGLQDFGNFLTVIGDSSASTYLNAASGIGSGMQQTYTSNVYNGTVANKHYLNLPGFLNAWQQDAGFTGPLPMGNPVTFYPDAISQIFPQAYRVPVPSSMYAGGWTFLRSFDFQSNSVDSADPWTIIGLAATYNGDNTTANAMLTKTRGFSGVPINEWGFYRRIVLFQKYGFIDEMPSLQVNPNVLPTPPPSAAKYFNLQNQSGNPGTWMACSGGCTGSSGGPGTSTLTFSNASPALSGASMAMTSSGSNYWNTMYYRDLACPDIGCAAVKNMLEDSWFNPQTVTDMQQLEFDPDLFNAGWKYFGSVACRLVGANAGFWHLWNSANNGWDATSYPCTAATIAPGTWHHLQLYITFDTSTQSYAYQTFVYDGVTVFQNLGKTYGALALGGGSTKTSMNIEQEIDNGANNSTITVFYDNINLWAW